MFRKLHTIHRFQINLAKHLVRGSLVHTQQQLSPFHTSLIVAPNHHPKCEWFECRYYVIACHVQGLARPPQPNVHVLLWIAQWHRSVERIIGQSAQALVDRRDIHYGSLRSTRNTNSPSSLCAVVCHRASSTGDKLMFFHQMRSPSLPLTGSNRTCLPA